MKIAVLQYYDDNYREVGEMSTANKRPYCERHGYAYHPEADTDCIQSNAPVRRGYQPD